MDRKKREHKSYEEKEKLVALNEHGCCNHPKITKKYTSSPKSSKTPHIDRRFDIEQRYLLIYPTNYPHIRIIACSN